MPSVRRILTSLVARAIPRRVNLQSTVMVVALIVDEKDRSALASIRDKESLNLHFAESCDEGRALATQRRAPVILFDRDWPETEWRTTVKSFAETPHNPCVILTSGVADDYLWQELIRWGGHDVLPKPLRADTVARAVKLALAYWNSARTPAPLAWRDL